MVDSAKKFLQKKANEGRYAEVVDDLHQPKEEAE